jgi:hypothetical protein
VFDLHDHDGGAINAPPRSWRSLTDNVELREEPRMSDAKLRQPQRGDERLLLACRILERLCADRVPASERLEAAIGPASTRSLVVPLARRLSARPSADRAPETTVRVVAAA